MDVEDSWSLYNSHHLREDRKAKWRQSEVARHHTAQADLTEHGNFFKNWPVVRDV